MQVPANRIFQQQSDHKTINANTLCNPSSFFSLVFRNGLTFFRAILYALSLQAGAAEVPPYCV